MFKKILATLGALLLTSSLAFGQAAQPVVIILGASSVSASNPLPITGSFSATLSGFAPGGAFAHLTSGAASADVALPAGTVAMVFNTGTTAVSCNFTVGAGVAVANENVIQPGSWTGITVGSNTHFSCINQAGDAASNVVVASGGTGLPTGAGGGSSGGGSGSNASVSTTGTAVPGSATYLGVNIGGNLTGWNGAVTNAGTFAVQATLSAETTKVIGTVNQGTSPWVVSNGGTFATQSSITTLGQQLAAASVPVVLTAAQITTLTPPAAITNFALETGGNLATLAGGVTSSVFQHNTKQINGVVPLMGNGVTGTGSQRVTIASDNTAFSVNATLQASSATAIGTVNPTTAANWGIGTATQNSASATNGQLALAQFNTTPTTITTGNMSPLQVDNAGNLLVNIKAGAGSGGTAIADNSAFTLGTTNETPIGCYAGTQTITANHVGIPACTTAGQFHVVVDSATGIAQGAANASQTISGIGGLASTNAPTATNGDWWPLSISPTSGGVRIDLKDTAANTNPFLMSLNTTPTVANGNGVVLTPASASAAAMSHSSGASASINTLVAKASAGNLYGFNCTAISGAAAGFCVAYNGSTTPSTGALTAGNVLDYCFFGTTAAGCSLSRIPMAVNYSTGIVILVTSAATPYTYTTGTDTAAISADYD